MISHLKYLFLYLAVVNCGGYAKKCTCGESPVRTRVVGGTEAKNNEFPWMAALVKPWREGWRHFCGGSVITARHVLTAGHCAYLKHAEDLGFFVGVHAVHNNPALDFRKMYRVATVTVHEGYDRNLTNDIALLTSEKLIVFNEGVGPICLPKEHVSLEGAQVIVAGWGYTDNRKRRPDALMAAKLKVVNYDECKKVWKKWYVLGKQLCTDTNGKDSCGGDSGGPLMWVNPKTQAYTQIALVSFGQVCAGSKPGVNTDVWEYIDWIEEHVADDHESICTGFE